MRQEAPRALWRELTAYAEYRALLRSPVFAGRGVAPGRGRPVLLVPGFLSPDRGMAMMAGWLRRNGHWAALAHNGVNVACGEEAASRLERRLEAIAGSRGQPVTIVGHSRGGHFARVLAVRRPDLVRGIVSLGSPSLDPRCVHPLVALPAIGVSLLGTARLPGFFRLSCFLGSCCSDFRDDLQGRFPDEVDYVEVVSPADGIVDVRRVRDPWATRRVEITATHTGMVVNPEAYEALADALA